MKYRLLFVFLLVLPMLFSAEAIAQSVCSASLSFSDTAIVRTFGKKKALTYTGGYFVLCEGSNNVARAFKVPFNVKDVEVWEDSVAYFCGEYGGYGVMGCFNIMGAFSGTAPINYALTNVTATSPGLVNCYAKVIDLTRLALFWDSTYNAVALAMVCRQNLLTPDWDRMSVMGACFNPAGFWLTSVLYNKDGRKVYHDIETLDNLVVATMTDTNQVGCYTRAFRNTDYHFPYNPCIPFMADKIVLNSPMGPPQIARLNGNTAAVVQYDNKPGVTMHFLDFDIATGHPSAICQSAVTLPQSPFPYNPAKWWFNGVRYLKDTLYVLGQMNFPGEQSFEKWLLELPEVLIATSGLMHRFISSEPFSMEVEQTSWRPVSAGKVVGSGWLDWDVYIPQNNTECKKNHEIDISRQYPTIIDDSADGEEVFAFQNNIQLFPDVKRVEITKECGNILRQE